MDAAFAGELAAARTAAARKALAGTSSTFSGVHAEKGDAPAPGGTFRPIKFVDEDSGIVVENSGSWKSPQWYVVEDPTGKYKAGQDLTPDDPLVGRLGAFMQGDDVPTPGDVAEGLAGDGDEASVGGVSHMAPATPTEGPGPGEDYAGPGRPPGVRSPIESGPGPGPGEDRTTDQRPPVSAQMRHAADNKAAIQAMKPKVESLLEGKDTATAMADADSGDTANSKVTDTAKMTMAEARQAAARRALAASKGSQGTSYEGE